VVFCVGETAELPFAATVPRTGDMETLVALFTCQVSVDDCPELMVAGFAENWMICGPAFWPPCVTVTPMEHVLVAPLALLAVTM
jgi:hypothetical protein